MHSLFVHFILLLLLCLAGSQLCSNFFETATRKSAIFYVVSIVCNKFLIAGAIQIETKDVLQ